MPPRSHQSQPPGLTRGSNPIPRLPTLKAGADERGKAPPPKTPPPQVGPVKTGKTPPPKVLPPPEKGTGKPSD
jgi:hypothetical protein